MENENEIHSKFLLSENKAKPLPMSIYYKQGERDIHIRLMGG